MSPGENVQRAEAGGARRPHVACPKLRKVRLRSRHYVPSAARPCFVLRKNELPANSVKLAAAHLIRISQGVHVSGFINLLASGGRNAAPSLLRGDARRRHHSRAPPPHFSPKDVFARRFVFSRAFVRIRHVVAAATATQGPNAAHFFVGEADLLCAEAPAKYSVAPLCASLEPSGGITGGKPPPFHLAKGPKGII